jgi:predicted component of type VI protein secretion system
MNVELAMVKGDGTQRTFPLQKERLVIGRINTCDLRIALPSVSRQHCEVYVEAGNLKLRDLGSSNGTFHNNTRVQEAVLSAGDEIGVGPVVFRVVIDGKPAVEAGAPKAAVKPAKDVVPPAKAAAPPKPAQPAKVARPKAVEPEEEEEALVVPEDEQHSPTVDMDDPLAALAAAAGQGVEDDLPVLLDEDEPLPPPPAPKGKKAK